MSVTMKCERCGLDTTWSNMTAAYAVHRAAHISPMTESDLCGSCATEEVALDSDVAARNIEFHEYVKRAWREGINIDMTDLQSLLKIVSSELLKAKVKGDVVDGKKTLRDRSLIGITTSSTTSTWQNTSGTLSLPSSPLSAGQGGTAVDPAFQPVTTTTAGSNVLGNIGEDTLGKPTWITVTNGT